MFPVGAGRAGGLGGGGEVLEGEGVDKGAGDGEEFGECGCGGGEGGDEGGGGFQGVGG